MKRRQFITFLGGAAAAWPLAARGQISRKRPLIGRLSLGSRDNPTIIRYIEAFLSGMRELGYVEGRDFDMTYGMADFHADRLPQVAAEMVKLAPDAIEAGSNYRSRRCSKSDRYDSNRRRCACRSGCARLRCEQRYAHRQCDWNNALRERSAGKAA